MQGHVADMLSTFMVIFLALLVIRTGYAFLRRFSQGGPFAIRRWLNDRRFRSGR